MRTLNVAFVAGIPTLALIFSIQPVAHADGCVAPPPGLVFWLPGDDNPTDIVGGHNGTLVGNTTYAPGEVLDAFAFDGHGDWVEVADTPALSFCQTCPMSVELWAYRSSSNTGHLFGKRAVCNGGSQNYQALWVAPEQLQWGSDSLGVGTPTGVDALPLNTWTYVALTYDYDADAATGTVRIYLNGELQATNTGGLLGPPDNGPLLVGRSSECEEFAGGIDEMKIYNRALTPAEIQGIYAAGSAGNCKNAPVVAKWKMSPQSGDWNTATNWMGNVAPVTAVDTARFGTSNTTHVSLSADVALNSMVFLPGASAYEMDDWEAPVALVGAGVTNNSGVVQNWDLDNDGTFAFKNSATAGKLMVYTAEAGSVAEGGPGHIEFDDTSTAGSATLIANGGVIPGTIEFLDSSLGGKSRVEILGGTLDISAHAAPGVTVGSIEGTSGLAFLGGNRLTVGGNNLSSSFDGEILDGILTSHGADSPLAGGALTKAGTGTLTLGGANIYSGGTIVNGGALLLANTTGSGTGTGSVLVNAGTLGGSGRAAGAVNIGNGSGPRATLAPGFTQEILDLLIGKKLTFKSDGDFVAEFDSGAAAADQVVARGVTINPGANFTFAEVGTGAMQVGTVFVLINNTATTPISGTFSGLPEGATFVAGNYLWRVSYVGGSGNDFTGEILEQT